MPTINWEEISDIKHQISQERTIIVGATFALKQSIEKLDILDKHLIKFEDKLVDLIMNHSEENNERSNVAMDSNK